MDKQVNQLVEMGATTAQARAALRKYKDVMEAAEHIFSGEFEDVMDTEDSGAKADVQTSPTARPARMMTPTGGSDSGDGSDNDIAEDDDDDEADYVDYDSDREFAVDVSKTAAASADPYASVFFSKDRREEIIEVEEEQDTTRIVGPDGKKVVLNLMTQGQWMKGCPEGGEQSFLFQLWSMLTEGECACPHDNCAATPIQRQKSDFFVIFSTFDEYLAHITKLARRTCPKCKTVYCYGCREPITATSSRELFHCENLQGVILGMGLYMVEQKFEQQRSNISPSPSANSKKRKAEEEPQLQQNATPNEVLTPEPEDDELDDAIYTVPGLPAGFQLPNIMRSKGKKSKGGIGYAGAGNEDRTGQQEALTIQRAKDSQMASLLGAVRVYLPNLRRAGGAQKSDYEIHPASLAHLRRRFNYVSSILLRNDSLTDMSDRSELYFELFEWLETISNHEALASMMGMPIMVISTTKPAVTKKRADGSQIRERAIVYEGSAGPRELLEALVIQAQAAMKGLEGAVPPDPDPNAELSEEQKRITRENENADDKGKGKAEIPEENVTLMAFCKRILGTAAAIDRSLEDTKGVQFMERLRASLPRAPTSSRLNKQKMDGDDDMAGKQPWEGSVRELDDEAVRKVYMDWATLARFEYCDLTIAQESLAPPPAQDNRNAAAAPGPAPAAAPAEVQQINYKFYYNNEARMLANADMPKRSLAIAKELAVLTTNLPIAWDSSIFLRVDETRVDIIKALITGPAGTPYHNGCYLFDIFLGSSYSQSPPNVKYMTTGGGKLRFNPNLYADGKVCLSLLGTWSGPGWIPGRSTLLQVLISIQSMILCEEPYLNEPGWAESSGTPQSKAYSANVRRMVVNTAMLANLKNPPEPFEDVIRTHFKLKAREIRKQLDDWVALDDGHPIQGNFGMLPKGKGEGGSGSAYQKDVKELKSLLEKL